MPSQDTTGYRAGTPAWVERDLEDRIAELEDAGGGGSAESPAWSDWITLTDADIKALPTTGVEIQAAPGAGKYLRFHAAELILDATAGAYTNISEGSTVQLRRGGIYVSGQALDWEFLLAATGEPQVTELSPNLVVVNGAVVDASSYNGLSYYENQPIEIFASNTDGNLTGGHTDNTLNVRVLRSVLELPN